MPGKRKKDSIGLDWNSRAEVLRSGKLLPLDQIDDKLWDVRTGEIGLRRRNRNPIRRRRSRCLRRRPSKV